MSAKQTVITQKQAKQITGGRTPLVPVVYEEALKALDACITLDEAKYWDSKADALAAWAKIYRSDETGRKAAALKLHAYRRMGLLANELRPSVWREKKQGTGQFTGLGTGPAKLLREQGLTEHQATAARSLARANESIINEMASRPRPPTPYTAKAELSPHSVWMQFNKRISGALTEIRKQSPVTAAKSIETEYVDRARSVALQMIDWLDEFERHLPKTIDADAQGDKT